MNVRKFVGLYNLDTSQVLDMSLMFCGCGVEQLDLRSFQTNRVEGMVDMFYDCPWLESLDISTFNPKNLQYANMFLDGCDSLHIFYASQAISKILDMYKPKEEEYCRTRSA